MESERFDALAARLAVGLSRRRSVGLLALLGLSGVAARDATDAKKRKKKKKKKGKKATTPAPVCKPACGSRACGDNGCGGSCGECGGELVCRNGACGCPEGKDLCGGVCHPACPPSGPGRMVERHPETCTCCVRPGSYPCPDAIEQCCVGPEDLPCCARPCEPLAVGGECQAGLDPEGGATCHDDVECYPGFRCPEGAEPRLCELIPG